MPKENCFGCNFLRFHEDREEGMPVGYSLICVRCSKRDVRGQYRNTGDNRFEVPYRKSSDCFEVRQNSDDFYKPIEF